MRCQALGVIRAYGCWAEEVPGALGVEKCHAALGKGEAGSKQRILLRTLPLDGHKWVLQKKRTIRTLWAIETT